MFILWLLVLASLGYMSGTYMIEHGYSPAARIGYIIFVAIVLYFH